MKVKYNLIKKEANTQARLGTIETNYGTFDSHYSMHLVRSYSSDIP